MRFVIVTGMSGAGKSSVLKMLEDAGYFCVDNLPVSLISKFAEIAIEVETGPEILSGSTRLKAGTAEKLILNMISTVSMIKIGKVYKNLMVDVQQTNEKLMVRAENIVMQAVDCEREEAKSALAESGGEAKTAILKLLLGVNVEVAREMLEKSGGRIKSAMQMGGHNVRVL